MSPKNSEILKTKVTASGLSNKFKTVDFEAPPKPARSSGSKMIQRRQIAEKTFTERKLTEFP